MTADDPIEELCNVAREFRHLQPEHQREGAHGSWRRRQGSRLRDLEQRFESLLTHRVLPEDRAAWHEHFYRGAPVPTAVQPRPVVFEGRSEVGSVIDIRRGEDRAHEVVADGTLVGRLPEDAVIDTPFHFGDSTFHEVFDAPAHAIEALREYARSRSGGPPWQWSRALYEDGLIDASFGLTPRGRRLCQSREADIETVRRGRSRRVRGASR